MKKHKYAIIITVLMISLLISFYALFVENLDSKWELIYEKAVPDVELQNFMYFNDKNIAQGSIVGFVAFKDLKKQPKDLRQYIKIEASNQFNNEGKQIFYLTEIIKMDFLAPRYFDLVILTSTYNTTNFEITLVDSKNNQYIININKDTNKVRMFDNTEDVSYLIIDQSEFQNFIVEFLGEH